MRTFDDYSPKRVSYILVTKNRASLLKKALEKCRAFVQPEDELIVVDGGSNDGTREVVQQFKDIVDVFISEPDRDGSHAQNKGMLLARGKYVRSINDDDMYHPEALAEFIRVFDAHPEVDMLLCGGTKEQNGVHWDVLVPPDVEYGKKPEDVFVHKGSPRAFIRRSSLAKFGLFPKGIAADMEHTLIFISGGGIVRFCRLNVYHHVIDNESTVIKYKNRHFRETRRLAKKYCSRNFYTRYLFKTMLMQYPSLYRGMRHTIRFFCGKRRYVWGRDFSSASLKKEKILWDGGVS